MRTTALALSCLAFLTGCGVTTQDEPQPLVTSAANPAPTPTLTQRPDQTTSPSSATTTTSVTAPPTTTAASRAS